MEWIILPMLILFTAIMLFVCILLGVLSTIRAEKKVFNNHICPKCGKDLHLFDVDSQGGRGYCCNDCKYYAWVSYDCVDKHFKYTDNKLTMELQARGYRKYPSPHSGECGWFKSFGKSELEEDRSNYQICYDVYNFTQYANREPHFKTHPYGVEKWVLVSRAVDERLDLLLSPNKELSIEETEKLADSFYQWVEKEI